MALGLRRLHRRRRHAGRAASACPRWREHIALGGVRVFDQDGTVVGYSRRRRTTSSRASTSIRPPRAPASAAACWPTRRSASAPPGTRARGCTCTPRTRTGAPSTSATAGWRSAGCVRRGGTGARPRPALRAGRLMGVLVAVTDHAVERFRQRIGGRAGEVDARPEIVGARGARVGGRTRRRASRRRAPPARAARSTCATSSTARWSSSAAMTAPPARSSSSRCGRPRAARRRRAWAAEWTDTLRRGSG